MIKLKWIYRISIVFLFAATLFIYSRSYSSIVNAVKKQILEQEYHTVEIAANVSQQAFDDSETNLIFIADLFSNLFAASFYEGSEKFDLELERINQMFFSFARANPYFIQIRYLNLSGLEIIRVNNEKGVPYLVPEEELQDKSSRNYFKEAILLSKGDIYYSDIDLNMEHGRIE